MTRAAAMAALRGGHAGFVTGVSWVTPGLLGDTVRSEGLDFGFVPAGVYDGATEVGELHSLDAAAIWAVPGVLGRVAESMGWAEAMRLSAARPGALAVPLAQALHEALEMVRAGIAAGADCVLVADDLASASGPLVAPDFALDALVPCYRSIAAEVIGEGVAAFHSDGDVRVLMPSLAHAGYSAVHLAGLSTTEVLASVRSARSAGLVAMGGIVAAGIEADPVSAGAFAGRLASKEGVLVCDDGGLATPADMAAFGVAVGAARDAYAESQAGA